MAPIINSLLDLDFYKLTMGQFVWKKYSDVPVKYAFKNRTRDVRLGKIIKEVDLRRELDHINDLEFTPDEYNYLKNLGMFSLSYINFLTATKLPNYNLRFTEDGNIDLTFSGPWSTAIYWETFALSIISELYYKAICPDGFLPRRDACRLGTVNLTKKLHKLSDHPDIRFSDFGTRRRFSQGWHEYIVGALKGDAANQFIGTSNVDLARRYYLKPIGTMAHELFMVMTGIYYGSNYDIFTSQTAILNDWWGMYGEPLSIALTDTYGSATFLCHIIGRERAVNYRGLRQDSGDPIEFGERAIKFYEAHGIDPKEKLIVFSDGLDIDKIVEIHERFAGRIQTSFGWGTSLTNDLGLKPLSLVVKAVEANGHGLVKLSDNLAKAIGKPEDIQRYKDIFGYTGNNYREVKY